MLDAEWTRSAGGYALMRPDPALEGISGERRHRVLGRLPADLGYEPIAESGAAMARRTAPVLAGVACPRAHFASRAAVPSWLGLIAAWRSDVFKGSDRGPPFPPPTTAAAA